MIRCFDGCLETAQISQRHEDGRVLHEISGNRNANTHAGHGLQYLSTDILKATSSICAMVIQLNDGVIKYSKMELIYSITKATKQLAVKKLTTASSYYQDPNHRHRTHQHKG